MSYQHSVKVHAYKLRVAERQAKSLVKKAAAAKAAVESQLASQHNMLASVNSDIRPPDRTTPGVPAAAGRRARRQAPPAAGSGGRSSSSSGGGSCRPNFGTDRRCRRWHRHGWRHRHRYERWAGASAELDRPGSGGDRRALSGRPLRVGRRQPVRVRLLGADHVRVRAARHPPARTSQATSGTRARTSPTASWPRETWSSSTRARSTSASTSAAGCSSTPRTRAPSSRSRASAATTPPSSMVASESPSRLIARSGTRDGSPW